MGVLAELELEKKSWLGVFWKANGQTVKAFVAKAAPGKKLSDGSLVSLAAAAVRVVN